MVFEMRRDICNLHFVPERNVTNIHVYISSQIGSDQQQQFSFLCPIDYIVFFFFLECNTYFMTSLLSCCKPNNIQNIYICVYK